MEFMNGLQKSDTGSKRLKLENVIDYMKKGTKFTAYELVYKYCRIDRKITTSNVWQNWLVTASQVIKKSVLQGKVKFVGHVNPTRGQIKKKVYVKL